MWKWRVGAGVVVAVLAAVAWRLPGVRRELMYAVSRWDARPAAPAPLPSGNGPGLPPAPHTRVILIDGLTEEVAAPLPAWSAVCARGATLRVDVGFPTVSLPVAVSLWTGLTQQQTGIMNRYNRPIEPPLARSIPAQVPGSIGITEGLMVQKGDKLVPGHYGWIMRSLGFARAEPPADPKSAVKDQDAEAWSRAWEARAREAVAGDARLVYVHLMRVDVAGHHHGLGAEYRRVAGETDVVVGRLVAARPDARWFLVSDHGHIPTGGHGGEELTVRQVQACVAGPGIAPARGALVHVVDLSRALADSTGATLDREARGRPFTVALAAPLHRDQSIPALALGAGAAAIFVLVGGIALATWGVRRWWLAPWWFVAAGLALLFVRGEPTLSMPMVYARDGRDMWLTWAAALPIAAVTTWLGLRATTLARVVIAQLAIPWAATAAALTACGAWPMLLGEESAPVVPRYTAYASPLLLIAAHGAAAVALAVLARLVLGRSGRRGPPAPPRSERAAAAPDPAGAATDPAG
ncbi:MAG TPA: alkaline phosphatase family protein [Kofleriaceae bacterium]|nr:alkaline phosphatase family protein [Kofleriaceae bacterium]